MTIAPLLSHITSQHVIVKTIKMNKQYEEKVILLSSAAELGSCPMPLMADVHMNVMNEVQKILKGENKKGNKTKRWFFGVVTAQLTKIGTN